MSAGFRAVQWNRAKLVYDGILLAGVVLYIDAYLTLVYWLDPPKDQPAAIDLRIRAFGTCAFFMLTVILSIGPLARLDRRFLTLLYNRRHFGVLTFFVVLLHASFIVEWYAVRNALPSLYDELTKVPDYGKFIGFPFKALGLKRLCLRDGAPSRGWLARAGGRPRRRSGQRGLALGRAAALNPRQRRPHRRGAGWRTHRSLPRWHADRGVLESLRPPAWADRRRAHHRRLRDLPLARLPVPAEGRLRAAAVHRKARHLPRARCAWRGRSRPAPAAAGYAGGDKA